MRTLLVVLPLVIACAPADRYATQEESVVNGMASTTPWVVMVVQQPEGSSKVRLCTGTVIAPRAVLTAKHCVYRDDGTTSWTKVPLADLTIRTGSDFRSSDKTIAATDVVTTEGAYTDGSGRNGGDIAVVLVGEDLGIEPRTLSRSAATVGQAVQLHGYGYTVAGSTNSADLGIKHVGDAEVETVESLVFATTGNTWTCTGDSGGPVIDTASGEVVGVTSIGPSGCRVSTSYATRVDAYLPLLTSVPGVTWPTDGGQMGVDAGTDGDPSNPIDPKAAGCASAGTGSLLMLLVVAATTLRRLRRLNTFARSSARSRS